MKAAEARLTKAAGQIVIHTRTGRALQGLRRGLPQLAPVRVKTTVDPKVIQAAVLAVVRRRLSAFGT